MERIKIQLVLTVLLLNLTCFIGVFCVGAYLTDTKQADNIYSVGNNEIEIVEVYREVDEIKPGMLINKDVAVKNTGKNDCRVRVLVLYSDCEAEGYSTIDYNLKDWQPGEGGYYYYSSVLPAGATTESLFTEVKVSDDADAESIKGFEIYVYAESINVEAGGFAGSGAYDGAWGLCMGCYGGVGSSG